jgi:hypothetical protein
VEQFTSLFVVVAFVLWLVIFVPDRVRSKYREKNSGYEDKFSTGVRILRDAQQQLKNEKKLRANSAQTSTSRKPLAFYKTTTFPVKTKCVHSSTSTSTSKVPHQRVGKMSSAQKSKTGRSLAFSNVVCRISLAATVVSWSVVTLIRTGAVIVAVVTLVYLVALLNNHLKKVVASRVRYGARVVRQNSSSVQKSRTPVAVKPQKSVRSKLEVANNRAMNSSAEYATAKSSFDRTKVLVGDFSPRKYAHNHSINSALKSQLDYASSLVNKFDDELDAIDYAGRSYRLKSNAKSSR